MLKAFLKINELKKKISCKIELYNLHLNTNCNSVKLSALINQVLIQLIHPGISVNTIISSNQSNNSIMIKLIVFSCVFLTLINQGLTLEQQQQDNVYQQKLNLRFKRSSKGSTVGSTSSSAASSAASTTSVTDKSDGNPLFDSLPPFLSGLNPDKMMSLTLGQIGNLGSRGGAEASIKSIINVLEDMLTNLGTTATGAVNQMMSSDMSPIKLLNANGGAGSGSGSTLIRGFTSMINQGSSAKSAAKSASAATAGQSA